MLTPKKIETFCRWWSQQIKQPVDSGVFFTHAFKWKYGDIETTRLYHAYMGYRNSGIIPDFVKEYWRYRVLSFILIRGGDCD